MLDEPILFKIKDKEYKVEGFTGEIQSAFERYFEFHALNYIKEAKSILGDEYQNILNKYIFDRKAGVYKFSESKFFEFLNMKEEAHFAQLMWWCLNKHQPISLQEVKDLLKENEQEFVELFNLLIITKKK